MNQPNFDNPQTLAPRNMNDITVHDMVVLLSILALYTLMLFVPCTGKRHWRSVTETTTHRC